MELEPIKIIKTKEKWFKIKRDAAEGIKYAYCAGSELEMCLKYIENYGFFPIHIELNVEGNTIFLSRSNYSGRVRVNYQYRYGNKNYPQSFSDKRIINLVRNSLSNK